MSYLPTAQRLSFSVIKATNLKYEEITDSVENFGECELRPVRELERTHGSTDRD